MGFFGKEPCPICKKEVGVMNKASAGYNGKFICYSCYKKLYDDGMDMSSLSLMPLEMLQSRVCGFNAFSEEAKKRADVFNPTQKVGNHLWVDNKRQLIAIPKKIKNNFISVNYEVDSGCPILSSKDIIDYELIEDGVSITKGGVSIGRALVGGVLFGGVGAVIGGVTGERTTNKTCTSLVVKITVDDMYSPIIKIDLLSGLEFSQTTGLQKNSIAYKNVMKDAESIMAILDVMCCSTQTKSTNNSMNSTMSPADEIRKFKGLLDDGIITQQEFDAKKKELLGL